MPGALPCFEAFGNLPTDLIRADGLVDGKPASEVLEMIIIPGGSLVESGTITNKVSEEIAKMANAGKLVLGICSGFQVLSKGTDIGRLSTVPIIRKGLGLIDAEFSPLICTDQVKATITGKSFLTDTIGAEVTGFHCHTYGNIILHEKARPILVSHTKRLNYHKDTRDLVSGISNSHGNVVGIIVHALLDKNPLIIEGIQKALGISADELLEIRMRNAKLLEEIKREVGISTNIYPEEIKQKLKRPKTLLITALGSGSGKTFIVTGLAGALKKRGLNVGVVKVGGDIRDVVPAQYLIKEPIRNYSSIKIGESGWTAPVEAVQEAGKEYDFLLIEGAMSAFTGLLNENVVRPSSTAEVAVTLGVSTVIVVGCDKEGIEGALVSSLNYVNLLKKLGVKVKGVILNKVRTSYLTDNIREIMRDAFGNSGAELLGVVPRIDLEGRGAIPEIEIKYEEFSAKAIETVEKSINLERVIENATSTDPGQPNYDRIIEKFKSAITRDFGKRSGDKEI